VLGVCMVFMLGVWRPLRFAVFAGAAFLLVGFLAAGWHYTIRVYAGLALAVAMWWCAGLLIKRTTRRRPANREAQLAAGPLSTPAVGSDQARVLGAMVNEQSEAGHATRHSWPALRLTLAPSPVGTGSASNKQPPRGAGADRCKSVTLF